MSFEVERLDTMGSFSSTKFYFFLVRLSARDGISLIQSFSLAHHMQALPDIKYGTTLVSWRPLNPGSKLAHVRAACWRG